MKTQDIQLTMKEQNRIKVLSLLKHGEVTTEQAKHSLGCCERSLYLWMKKIREFGPSGLIHGNRGSQSPRRTKESEVEKILGLKRETYFDFNDVHFKECLEHNHGIKIARETLRSLLRTHQIAPKQKRRRKRYYQRRERKAGFGMMIQIDASQEHWLGELRPKFTLHGGIDDATGKVWAIISANECMYGYFDMMREILEQDGIPVSLYSDRHTIFHTPDNPTVLEQMKGENKHLTQFGRAMQELGVNLIKAYSPQAKGRIERLWRTFQDRLIAEMRLAGIATKEEAQEFLKDFLRRYNKQFCIKPKNRKSCFRKSPRKITLDDILCLKEQRVVRKDHTVHYQRQILAIPNPKGWRTYALKKVEVWERQDGIIKIALNKRMIASFQPQQLEDILGQAA